MRRLQISVIAVALFGTGNGWSQAKLPEDQQALQGGWRVVQQLPADAKPNVRIDRLVFIGDKLTWHTSLDNQRGVNETTIKFGAAAKPKILDFTNQRDAAYTGIYELKDQTLKVCYRGPGKKRPSAFTAEGDSVSLILVRDPVVGP